MYNRSNLASRRLLIIGSIILLVLPGLVLAANLLSSGTFETFESYNGENWREYPEEKGKGWAVTVLEEDGLHFLKSDVFGQFASKYYGVPYLNYRLEGNYSQVFASRRAFNFVFSQTVNVDTGHDYALGGKIVTFWKGSGGERDDTKIFKRIGLDPTGGAVSNGPDVIWTEWEGLDNVWTSPALAMTAQATQTTVFIQVENKGGDVGAAYLNTGHLDSFRFERAPVATLNLPATASPGPLEVSWRVDIPDPGFWALWGYDVQLKNQVEDTWQTLQTHHGSDGKNNRYTLEAQAGRIYTFRVRPWQERPGGDAAITALPGVWQEKSVTVGQGVTGQVTDHLGLGLGQVTISSSEGDSTTADPNGHYHLATDTGVFTVTAGNANGLQAPPPTVITVTANAFTLLPLVLYPTGAAQALANNHFETDLAGWQASDPSAVGVSPTASRTGQGGLLITNSAQISQTNPVSGIERPTLSFWYKSEQPLAVELLAGPEKAQLQAAEVAANWTLEAVVEWTFVTLTLNDSEIYETLGVNFVTSGGLTSIDEVSLGPGGRPLFMPLIFKN